MSNNEMSNRAAVGVLLTAASVPVFLVLFIIGMAHHPGPNMNGWLFASLLAIPQCGLGLYLIGPPGRP